MEWLIVLPLRFELNLELSVLGLFVVAGLVLSLWMVMFDSIGCSFSLLIDSLFFLFDKMFVISLISLRGERNIPYNVFIMC